MSRLLRNIALGAGTVTGLIGYYVYVDGKFKAYNSWTTSYVPNPHAKWDFNWDHRHPDAQSKPQHKRSIVTNNEGPTTTTAVRHIILIRHGQYLLTGESDEQRKLTELGKLQAKYTGERLKELALPYNEIIKSTMCRAQETGSIISSSLSDVPVKHCDFIREGTPIPPEPPIGNWRSEDRFYQDGSRIEAAFRKYFYRADPSQKDDTYTILVCHANVIRYFVCRALQFPAEGWLRISLNNGSITWISITPSGRVILRVLGDSGHIPANCLTTT